MKKTSLVQKMKQQQMLVFQIMSLKKQVSLPYLEGLNCLIRFLSLHCCRMLKSDASTFWFRNSHLASHLIKLQSDIASGLLQLGNDAF